MSSLQRLKFNLNKQNFHNPVKIQFQIKSLIPTKALKTDPSSNNFKVKSKHISDNVTLPTSIGFVLDFSASLGHIAPVLISVKVGRGSISYVDKKNSKMKWRFFNCYITRTIYPAAFYHFRKEFTKICNHEVWSISCTLKPDSAGNQIPEKAPLTVV